MPLITYPLIGFPPCTKLRLSVGVTAVLYTDLNKLDRDFYFQLLIASFTILILNIHRTIES